MRFLLSALRFSVYIVFFIYEMVKANIQVAKLILSPGYRFKSAAIKYPSRVKTISEMVVLTNSITLTPGTLVMDANLKSGEILVHVMSGESTEQIKKDIHDSLERRMLWAMRDKEKP